MPITWTEDWCVGNQTIDYQHKNLVDLVNRAELCALDADGESYGMFYPLLNDVSLYAKTHFADEEKLLSAIDYQGLGNQIKQHAAFNECLTDFILDAMAAKEDRIKFSKFMADWLSHHVLVEDMKFKPEMKTALP
jgi:hemerythrin